MRNILLIIAISAHCSLSMSKRSCHCWFSSEFFAFLTGVLSGAAGGEGHPEAIQLHQSPGETPRQDREDQPRGPTGGRSGHILEGRDAPGGF